LSASAPGGPGSSEEVLSYATFPIGSRMNVAPNQPQSQDQGQGQGQGQGRDQSPPDIQSMPWINLATVSKGVPYRPSHKRINNKRSCGGNAGPGHNAFSSPFLTKRSSGFNINPMDFGGNSRSVPGFETGFANAFHPFTDDAEMGAGGGSAEALSWPISSGMMPLSPFGSFETHGTPGSGWSSPPPLSLSSFKPPFPSTDGGSWDWSNYGDNFGGGFDLLDKREDLDRAEDGCMNHEGDEQGCGGDSGRKTWKREDGVDAQSRSKYREMDPGCGSGSHYYASNNGAGDYHRPDESFGPSSSLKGKSQLVTGPGPLAGMVPTGLRPSTGPGFGLAGAGPYIIPVPIEVNTLVYPDGQTTLLLPDGK
ncbi:hypothetical protein BGZ65_011296, partial [Modicella reniformis]